MLFGTRYIGLGTPTQTAALGQLAAAAEQVTWQLTAPGPPNGVQSTGSTHAGPGDAESIGSMDATLGYLDPSS